MSTTITFTIDGVQVPVDWKGNGVCIGTIPYAMLEPGDTHTVNVNSSYSSDYATLVITYRVP